MKNFTPFCIASGFNISNEDLNTVLLKNSFTACTPGQSSSMGFVDPVNANEDDIELDTEKEDSDSSAGEDLTGDSGSNEIIDEKRFFRKIESTIHFAIKFEKKTVPAKAVQYELKLRTAKHKKEVGFVPGKKWKKEEKEKIYDELLPKAFPSFSMIPIYIDMKNNLLVVGSVSKSVVELIVSIFRKEFQSQNLSPIYIRTNHSPSTTLSNWILGGEADADFTVDMDGVIKNSESGGSIRFSAQNMATAEVCGHLKLGYSVESIALTYSSKISFIATNQFTFKKLKWCNIKNIEKHEDKESEFNANALLETADIASITQALISSYGGIVESI